jgi:hypothetical protein
MDQQLSPTTISLELSELPLSSTEFIQHVRKSLLNTLIRSGNTYVIENIGVQIEFIERRIPNHPQTDKANWIKLQDFHLTDDSRCTFRYYIDEI